MSQNAETYCLSAFDAVYPDRHLFIPLLGTYVLFSLDLQATLEFYCDDLDDIAKSAIRDTTGRFNQYVAYVCMVRIAIPRIFVHGLYYNLA
jgi:hypothetical protein